MSKLPNPYPGASPLTERHADLLLGRESILNQFTNAIRQRDVVELTGPSGVGKSSLLKAGIRTRLNDESGLYVRLFSRWDQVRGSTGGQWFAHALALAIGDLASATIDPLSDPQGFVDDVQERLGSQLVVVFDQLEELLRADPAIGRRFVQNIAQVAAVYPERMTQVVSLRREYKFALAPIDEQLHPNAVWFQEIKPIEISVIPQLIVRPLERLRVDHEFSVTATPDLVDAIASAWATAANSDQGPFAAADGLFPSEEDNVGLLHLQAFLFAMFERADPDDGDVLTARSVADVLGMPWPTSRKSGRRCFAFALKDYVKLRIEEQANAFREKTSGLHGSPVARLMTSETLAIAATLPMHLSSAGFKLVRGTDELAALVLTGFNELQTFEDLVASRSVRDGVIEADLVGSSPALAPAAQQEPAATERRSRRAQDVAGLLAQRCRDGYPDDPDGLHDEVIKRYPDLANWGDAGMATGRMSGQSALRTGCELVVTFERAVEWLEASALVRTARSVSRDGIGGDRTIALVHDRLGEATIRWGQETLRVPEIGIAAVVASVGKQVLAEPAVDDAALGPEELPEVTRLGWVGCNVTALFDGLDFRNCNFGGTIFNRCRFRNVAFEDCLMWGALFLGCIFEGDEGVTFRSTRRPATGEPSSRVQTLTIGRGSTISGRGIRFESLGGYGLFLDGVEGGPWALDRCEIQHVSMTGAGNGLGPGSVADSPALRHLSILGPVVGSVEIDRPDDPSTLVLDPSEAIKWKPMS